MKGGNNVPGKEAGNMKGQREEKLENNLLRKLEELIL